MVSYHGLYEELNVDRNLWIRGQYLWHRVPRTSAVGVLSCRTTCMNKHWWSSTQRGNVDKQRNCGTADYSLIQRSEITQLNKISESKNRTKLLCQRQSQSDNKWQISVDYVMHLRSWCSRRTTNTLMMMMMMMTDCTEMHRKRFQTSCRLF